MASSATQSWRRPYKDLEVLEIDWIAADDGSFTPVTTVAFEGWAYMGITNPGTPAPTDLYDIELLDEDGIDIFGSELHDRSTSASEQTIPNIGPVWGMRRVSGTLELRITGNVVSGAQGKLLVYVATPLRRV